MQTTQKSKNIIICSDTGVGKTTLLRRKTRGECTKMYKASLKSETSQSNLSTKIENVKFENPYFLGQDIKEKID